MIKCFQVMKRIKRVKTVYQFMKKIILLLDRNSITNDPIVIRIVTLFVTIMVYLDIFRVQIKC
jgi:hypothetical protein